MTTALLDWRSISDDKEKYAAYLCSVEWGRLRRAVTDRANGVCERCIASPMQSVHHLTYIRKYAEWLEDLQAVCGGCHEFIHGHSQIDPARCQRSRWRRELNDIQFGTNRTRIRELIRLLTTG